MSGKRAANGALHVRAKDLVGAVFAMPNSSNARITPVYARCSINRFGLETVT